MSERADDESQIDLKDESLSVDLNGSISHTGSVSKRQTPLKVKLKKYWSTKTAGTAIGRALIVQSLGPNGEDIFNRLKDSLMKHYGEAKAESIRTDLLKIALKTKILFDENYLNPTTLAPANKPFRDFCFQAVKDLNAELTKPGKVDVSELIKTLETLRTAVLRIYEPLIKPRNLTMLDSLFVNLSDETFLKLLLNNAGMTETRAILRKGLEPMAALLDKFDEGGSTQKQLCKSWNCPHLEVKSKGFFRGMGYCPRHHIERFGMVISEPNLKVFLEHKFLSVQLVDFLQNKLMYVIPPDVDEKSPAEKIISRIEFGVLQTSNITMYRASFYGAPIENPSPLLLHYYYFHEAIKQFEQIGSKGLRTSRVTQLEKKFLNPSNSGRYVWLPAPIMNDIQYAISESKVSKSLFEKADQFAIGVMDRVFQEFIKTVYYERAVVTVTLPPDVEIPSVDTPKTRASVLRFEDEKV